MQVEHSAVTGRAGIEGDLRFGQLLARFEGIVVSAGDDEYGAGKRQFVAAVAFHSPGLEGGQQHFPQIERCVEGMDMEAVA